VREVQASVLFQYLRCLSCTLRSWGQSCLWYVCSLDSPCKHVANMSLLVYTTEWPMGPWSICSSSYRVEGYNRRGSVTRLDGLCFCNGPRSELLGCAVLHSRCSNMVLGRDPSQEMINRLGTDLTWFNPSNLWFINHCHPRIDFPEPDGFEPPAISIAARKAGIPMLGRLPQELVVSIQSHCPKKPF
jgi:hypothetical protein